MGTSFVAKLSPDLKQLLWCTYVGGSGDESPRGGLSLDADDNVCLFGVTSSGDFPTTPGVHCTQRNGANDAFVAKLKADGTGLVWSTLFGGSAGDWMLGGRVDGEGNIIFTGHTTSPDLPMTPSAAQSENGGEHDGYVVKLSHDGSQLLYVTYLGGRRNEFPEHRPWVGEDGTALLPGVTSSQDFPTTADAFQQKLQGRTDAYLVKLSPDGRQFVFSTLFGGAAGEVSLMPIPDADGNILLVGQTESHDLPVTPDAFQKTHGGGRGDGWLAILNPDGSELLYCTYLGGSGDDMVRSMALGPRGEVYLVGHTSSSDFPVTAGAVQTMFGGGGGDAYLIKLVPAR
jgi:hypothetical protein